MASSADGLFEDDKNVDSSRLKLPEGVVFSPQKVVTGEENEKTVYMTVSRAFRRRDGQWKERGKGAMKLLQHKETGVVRLLLRQDKTKKVRINHVVDPTSELHASPQSDKVWLYSAKDYSDEELSDEVFMLTFRDVASAFEFKEHFDKWRASNASALAGKGATATAAPPAPSPSTGAGGAGGGAGAGAGAGAGSASASATTAAAATTAADEDTSDDAKRAVYTHDAKDVNANLTHKEAIARSNVISKVTYKLHLDLTSGTIYRGKCTITFDHSTPAEGTFLDFTGKYLTKLEVNGTACSDATWEKHRLQLPGSALTGSNTVVAEYTNEYDHTGAGFHHFVDPEDKEVYIYTNFEPYEAHRMLPCFDQPDLKAPLELSATAPSAWVVVGNGKGTRTAGTDGTDAWSFDKMPPISTYLFAVAAGGYISVKSATPDGIPLGLYARKSMQKQLEEHADELLTLTKQGLDFYPKYFDCPYPFSTYDQLFVPEFNEGAMENAGAVTFTEHYLFRDPPTDVERMGRADTLLHEMAHMWHGDLSTMSHWDGLWLNESFATFMAALAVAKATRFGDQSWANFYGRMKRWAYISDQLPSTHPIQLEVPDTNAAFQNFDGITYGKGASVLKNLHKIIGADAFREGMRTYFKKHAWGNTTLADFLAALQTATDVNMSDWGNMWLMTPGLNTIRPVVEESEGKITSFAIEQEAPEAHPTLREHKMDIAFLAADGTAVEHTVVVKPQARTELPEFVGADAPVAVVLNWNDHAFVKVRLDAKSASNLVSMLSPERMPSPTNRSLVWGIFYNMIRDAKLSAADFLKTLHTVLPTETDPVVLKLALPSVLAPCLTTWQPRAAFAVEGSAWFGIALAQMRATKDGDVRLMWSRILGACATATKETAAAYLKLIDEGTGIEGFELPQGQRWGGAELAAAYGIGDFEARKAAELKRDGSDRGLRSAASIDAAVGTAAAKEAAWKRFMDKDSKESYHVLASVMRGFRQRCQDELLKPYNAKFFAEVRNVFHTQKRQVAESFFHALCPPCGDTSAELDALKALLATLGDEGEDKLLKRLVVESMSMYERIVAARSLAQGGGSDGTTAAAAAAGAAAL